MNGMERTSHAFPLILLGAYLILFTILAFNPIDRPTWLVENATVWIIVGVLGILYLRGIRFSNTAYVLMSVLIFLHTIGGHYTFAKVPFDWFTDFFGFERNHYDRIAHFTVGFYAYAVAEWVWSKRLVANKFLLFTYPVFVLATVAMGYEIIEWIFAISTNPEAGAAYLGSQGDIWDAQKDMALDTLGAIIATCLFFFLRKKNIRVIMPPQKTEL
jgi:putative membrane protein